jgi:hypothetical protein
VRCAWPAGAAKPDVSITASMKRAVGVEVVVRLSKIAYQNYRVACIAMQARSQTESSSSRQICEQHSTVGDEPARDEAGTDAKSTSRCARS